MNDKNLMNKAADNIRILAASAVEKAKSGHPGGAMGGADFINVLYSEYLKYDPQNPEWVGRDRFFLDPGHIRSSHSSESLHSMNWLSCVSGVRLLQVTLSLRLHVV